MATIFCSAKNIKVYRNQLSNTYNNSKIHYKELKSCITNSWKNVHFIDIVIQNNQYNLHICCEDNMTRNTYGINNQEGYSEIDSSFVKVTRELNEWHIGTFTIERISCLSHGYDYDTETDINPYKSVVIPLGVPLRRIIEFYGVKGL
jgi:hypothetical protein